MREFNRKLDQISLVDGMLSEFSSAVLDSLLYLQSEEEIKGNLLELGCYKGKTALLLGLHLRKGERIDLVDIYDQLDRKILEENNIQFNMLLANSENRQKKLKLKKRSYRLVHCDTSHTYANTIADLNLSRKLVTEKGLICVDDFANLNYPGVIPAVYKFLFKRKKFVIFLITDEKAYICRKSQSGIYNNYVVNRLPNELLNRGFEVTLARTDVSRFSSAVYVRRTAKGESKYYGGEVFIDLFQSSPFGRINRIKYQFNRIIRSYPMLDFRVFHLVSPYFVKIIKLLTALRKTL